VTGRIAQWKGFFGWITPLQELGEDLKPLLEANKNLIYVSWRDVQPGLPTQPGQQVDFQVYTDDNGVAAADLDRLLQRRQ
jgi:cold shock CspA family protein